MLTNNESPTPEVRRSSLRLSTIIKNSPKVPVENLMVGENSSQVAKLTQDIEKANEEKRELVEMISQVSQELFDLNPKSRRSDKKITAWQNIFNKCKEKKHIWTKGTNFKYLRCKKWPNIKRGALERYRRGRKIGEDVTTEVDKLILSFVLENGDDGNANQEQPTEEKRDQRSYSPELSINEGSSSAANQVKSTKRRKMSNSESKIFNASEKTSSVRNRGQLIRTSPFVFRRPANRPHTIKKPRLVSKSGQTEEMGADEVEINNKTTPTPTDTHTDDSVDVQMTDDVHDVEEDNAMGGEGLSELEMELLRAKMRLCEAKARVNEEEANVNRLEKRVWEEVLNKSKNK